MPWQRADGTCRFRVDHVNRASIQLLMSAMTCSLRRNDLGLDESQQIGVDLIFVRGAHSV
jgi:hypothetical protein